MLMNHKTHLWYTRHDGEVSGPFTTSVLRNKLLLGRLTLQDEVSLDKSNWSPISQHQELQPDSDYIQAQHTKLPQDERRGLDRRQTASDHGETFDRRRKDRRTPESDEEIARRQLRTFLMQRYRQRKERMFWPILGTFLMLFAIALLAVVHPTLLPSPLPTCSAPPQPGVNWDNCIKTDIDLHDVNLDRAQLRNSQLTHANLLNTSLIDADLAYADLRFSDMSYSTLEHAVMIGANLKQADLSHANLNGANLSFADLTSANLDGTDLKNAKLGNAIWINGTLCAPGSIGKCLTNP